MKDKISFTLLSLFVPSIVSRKDLDNNTMVCYTIVSELTKSSQNRECAMSNRIVIEPTKFIGTKSGYESIGIRVYDSMTQAYDNSWDEIPDDDMEILKKAMDSQNSSIESMFELPLFNGVEIGGNWYSWDDIKHLFTK